MNSAASPNPGASRFADLFAGIDTLRRAAQRTAEPLVDLGVRLWLARIFVVSAILKLA